MSPPKRTDTASIESDAWTFGRGSRESPRSVRRLIVYERPRRCSRGNQGARHAGTPCSEPYAMATSTGGIPKNRENTYWPVAPAEMYDGTITWAAAATAAYHGVGPIAMSTTANSWIEVSGWY